MSLLSNPKSFFVEDVARGDAHRVDGDVREREEGRIVGCHVTPAIDEVDVEAAVAAQHGFCQKVGVEEAGACVVVGVLGLLSVGVILGLREGARELVVGFVVGDAQGDVEVVGGVVTDAPTGASRGEGRTVPVSFCRLFLAAQRIIDLVGGAPDADAAVVGVVASADEGDLPFRFPLAALGDDVDGAGNGRIPVKDAVGAPDHFDPLDLLKGDLDPVHPGDIGAVQTPAVEQDQIAKVARLGAEAPHVDGGLRGVSAVARDIQAHQAREHLGHAGGTRLLDVVGGDDGHVGRDFPDFLGVACGRDDHLTHPVGLPSFRGSLGWRRLRKCRLRCPKQSYKQNDQDPFTAQKTLHGDSSSPLGKNDVAPAAGQVYWLAAAYSPRLPGPLCRGPVATLRISFRLQLRGSAGLRPASFPNGKIFSLSIWDSGSGNPSYFFFLRHPEARFQNPDIPAST